MEYGKLIIQALISAVIMGTVGGFFVYLWHRFKKADDYITRDDVTAMLPKAPDMALYVSEETCEEFRTQCASSRISEGGLRDILKEHREEQRQQFNDFKGDVNKAIDDTRAFIKDVNRRVWSLSNIKAGRDG